MYLYVIINSVKRALFMWNTWPQTLIPISVADKNMYLCKKQCSNYHQFYYKSDKKRCIINIHFDSLFVSYFKKHKKYINNKSLDY